METADDYSEAIADTLIDQAACPLADLARRFSVSHVTVIRIVGRPQNEGLVTTEAARSIGLTSARKHLAARC